MSLSKVTRNYQVTIPADIRKVLHLQVGTLLDFKIKRHEIVIKPKKLVDQDQEWFWTEEWQKEEKKVDRDIKKKKLYSFKTGEEAIKWLKKK